MNLDVDEKLEPLPITDDDRAANRRRYKGATTGNEYTVTSEVKPHPQHRVIVERVQWWECRPRGK